MSTSIQHFDKVGKEIKIGSLCAFHKGGKSADLEILPVSRMTAKQIIFERPNVSWDWKYQRKPDQVIVIE
ncbi:hypothetical protein AVV44_gp249 [Cronobacter phage S13]|uniref:Uncharacterized protein n=1 Tax=Cronobacter phage LPCS28 TaxID=2924885 RepID=A0AAE9G7P7_9CAUD|nr:hypothetical protein AVV44_gp249 [Cronobacter phage S13]YP_010665772.1 hypothetical protein PQB73_gp252 [Cronobacter phage LPCS28]AIA64989.1 hypothetical protein S13_192 [Cronobacter phage S13]UNY46961.1 hypothetical protein EHEKIMEA_00078 [Cronobacter phage LPCS28]